MLQCKPIAEILTDIELSKGFKRFLIDKRISNHLRSIRNREDGMNKIKSLIAKMPELFTDIRVTGATTNQIATHYYNKLTKHDRCY